MTCEELSTRIYDRHIEAINEMNKAKSKKEAELLLMCYYRCSCAVLAIQSLCDKNGDVDSIKMESKVNRMMDILLEDRTNE